MAIQVTISAMQQPEIYLMLDIDDKLINDSIATNNTVSERRFAEFVKEKEMLMKRVEQERINNIK